MRTLFNDGWSYRTKATAFQELGGANGAQWKDVALPHDAIIGTPRSPDAPRGETTGYFSGGSFEYRRTLRVADTDRGKLVALEFDGVYRNANVYVNGVLAGQDGFGYSRFAVRVDPFLNFGADNEIRVDCRAHGDSRWYTGAGIYRDVHLIVKNLVHVGIDGLSVRTIEADSGMAVLEVATTVESMAVTTSTVRVTAVIVGPDGLECARGSAPVTVLPQGNEVVRQRLVVIHPQLWSVEHPALYTARLEVDADGIVDEESTNFGIRTLQLDPVRGLRVNGEPVKLRGACIHHDNGPLGSAAVRQAEYRKVRLLKEAGFNAIRSAHNPASPALLDACDRLGMLVMDETFDMWTSAKSDFDYSFEFSAWWESDVAAMVAKDINHPSVILYSIGNEIPETGNKFGGIWSRRLAEKIRSLDSTRYVTNGVNGFVSVLDIVLMGKRAQSAANAEAAGGGGVNQMMGDVGDMMNQIQASPMVTSRTEESFAALDVAGMNYGIARYEMDKEQFPSRIILGTESWPRDIAALWRLVSDNSHILGDFTWTGFDYLGEAGIGVLRYAEGDQGAAASFASGYPGLTAWSGDLDITGHRRPASYYREIVFGLRDKPYIAVQRPGHYGKPIAVATPWSWSDSISSWTWEGFEGKPIKVEVYADADEVELTLNGVCVGQARVGENMAFRADFDTVYQPGELTAVAMREGRETGRFTLISAGDDLQLNLSVESSDSSSDDIAFVNVQFEDAQGILRPGADRLVTISIDGPAVLLGFGSGNPTTPESFTDAQHTTFDGRALAIVCRTGAGRVTLTATADGVAPATILLESDEQSKNDNRKEN
ncbi:MAG: DUF4982 domain-containing protein [Propionibacteriaceae bacterium]|jgi:hypothetical protein|nr:DUF4982 domain-containing protein [Propionibacteriaceae bacterium]